MSGRRDIIHSREGLELKRATKQLVRAVGGTEGAAASLAECSGGHVRQQRMSDCTLPNTPDFMRIDEAAELEDLSHGQPGWPHVTRAMAKRQGFALLPLPERIVGETNLHRTLAAAVEEAGDVTRKVLTALADGRTPADELIELNIPQEIEEAIAAFANLKSVVDGILATKPTALRAVSGER